MLASRASAYILYICIDEHFGSAFIFRLGSTIMVILTIIFVAVVLFRLAKVIYNITRYLYIRSFYVNALKIVTVTSLALHLPS